MKFNELYDKQNNPSTVREIKKVGENICCLIEMAKEDEKPDFLMDEMDQQQVYKDFDENFDNFSAKKDNLLGYLNFEEEEVFL